MHVDKLTFDPAEAGKLMRKYKEHRAYSTPVDDEILRVAKMVEKQKQIIRGVGSIELAGINPMTHMPKLAIGRADDNVCYLSKTGNIGGFRMAGTTWVNGNTARNRVFEGTLPDWGEKHKWGWEAMMPHIPPDLRPKRGLQNYTVIWEAVWEKRPPIDPILCRRIGKSDFFVVLAQWDLSEVERFVLQSRIGRQ